LEPLFIVRRVALVVKVEQFLTVWAGRQLGGGKVETLLLVSLLKWVIRVLVVLEEAVGALILRQVRQEKVDVVVLEGSQQELGRRPLAVLEEPQRTASLGLAGNHFQPI
jgi:hypothetical protein